MEHYLIEKVTGGEIKKGNKIILGGEIAVLKVIKITTMAVELTFNDGRILSFDSVEQLEKNSFFRLVDNETTIEHLEKDIVNNPPHYTQSKHECIDIIEEIIKQCATPFSGYLLGNIQKYIWRFMYKNGIEDLKKAKWYLEKLISNEEKELI